VGVTAGLGRAREAASISAISMQERAERIETLQRLIGRASYIDRTALGRCGLLECEGPEARKEWGLSTIIPAVPSARRLPISKRKKWIGVALGRAA
jgi:hypothetical protein